jgi:hypothetical protein
MTGLAKICRQSTDPRGALDTDISVGFALSIGGSQRNQRMG